jgi:hypothetical protein
MGTCRNRARWGLTLLLLTLAACTAQAPLTTAALPTPATPPPAIATPPPATLGLPTAALRCFTRAELAAMPLEEIAAQPSLCFDSEDGVQTEIAQAEAIKTIRAFLQDPTRLMGFREVTYMGNSPSGALRVARFEDERGISYMVAVAAEKVLEMDPGASQPRPSGPTLSQEELQAMAEALIRRELPAFDDLHDRLTFQAGAKGGGLNFFRWEQPGAAGASGMPPLAQVGITDSGEVFSYLNTLYFIP